MSTQLIDDNAFVSVSRMIKVIQNNATPFVGKRQSDGKVGISITLPFVGQSYTNGAFSSSRWKVHTGSVLVKRKGKDVKRLHCTSV